MGESDLLVSICCLAYNHELYIRDCLEGIMMQKTKFSFEVLIHDDASTDKTASIIRDFEAKYPDIIKPIYQTENQYSKGKGVSRRFQFSRVNGKYIAMCEGDDYWTDPFKLQKQVDFLEANEDYGLVYTEFDRFYQSSKKIEKECFRNNLGLYPNTFEDFLINTWFLAPVTWLFRTASLPQINLYYKEDYVVGDLPILLIISANYKIGYIDESMAVYRVLQNSASHFKDYHKEYKFELGIFKIQMDFATAYNVQQSIIIKIKNKFYSYIFLAACLLNDIEVKNDAYHHLKENKLLSKKMEYISIITKYHIPRRISKTYVRLKFKFDFLHRMK